MGADVYVADVHVGAGFSRPFAPTLPLPRRLGADSLPIRQAAPNVRADSINSNAWTEVDAWRSVSRQHDICRRPAALCDFVKRGG